MQYLFAFLYTFPLSLSIHIYTILKLKPDNKSCIAEQYMYAKSFYIYIYMTCVENGSL